VAVKAKGVKSEVSISVAREPDKNIDKPTIEPPLSEQALKWSGEIPPQKWMNFYTKVLSKLVSAGGLKITVKVESAPDGGLGDRQTDDIRAALRGLGLNDNVE
jgi:hypothetical protein